MNTIAVYTAPGCYRCTGIIRTLRNAGIDPQVIDVTQDDAAREYVRTLGYQGLPVVETATTHWSGHRPERLAQLTA